MTDGCCVTNALAKLGIGTTRLDFIEFETIRVVQSLSDGSNNVIRGTLDHDAGLVTLGPQYVDFRIAFYMTAQNMNILLPIMGFTQSPTNTWTIGDPLSSTTIYLGMTGVPEHVFNNSFVSKWVMRGQRGSTPPRIDIWFRAYSRTEQPVNTFFVSATNPPLLQEYAYAFSGGTTFTFAGTQYAFNQYAIGLDYGLVAEWNNSITATNICPTDHAITVGAGLLYATCANTVTMLTNAFSPAMVTGSFSLAFTITVGAHTSTTTVNIANVVLQLSEPSITQKHDFVRLPYNGRGFSLGTTPSLIINNTP